MGMAELIAGLETKLVVAEATLAEVVAENRALQDRIALLEAELNRNSENSSKPPSADPVKPRQSRAERRAAARAAGRQGKQPGAPGANLAPTDPRRDDQARPGVLRVMWERPGRGRGGGRGPPPVLEIPEVRVRVTDHVAERRRCACGHETVGTFPSEARAPVCWGPEVRALAIYLMDRQHLPRERCAELLGELLDAPVSTGWRTASCTTGWARCGASPTTGCTAGGPGGAWVGTLVDRSPGGSPVHGLVPAEVEAILAVAEQWGPVDRSHRKLAHRGSYTGTVWVSPSTFRRVLAAHGLVLPEPPVRTPSTRKPWPDWLVWEPNRIWIWDVTHFTRARRAVFAIVDMVSRRWIDTLVSVEERPRRWWWPSSTPCRPRACSPTSPTSASTSTPTTPAGPSCSPCRTTAPR